MPAYSFVEHPADVIGDLDSTEYLGVDTEFVRERTFLSELCLVQVALPGTIFCIDPMQDTDNDAFWASLCGKSWVTHAARQDIEVIYQTTGRMPAHLFDTQIAAGLLGLAPQIGYAGLVAELFDRQLPKSHTRADWSRRPLPEALLQYAAEDVEYLLPAHMELSERLDRAGRLDWASEDSQQLLDKSLYEIIPADAIRRVKAARNLRGRRRLAAAALADWREREALKSNRPRQWILKDSTLVDIATELPSSRTALAAVPGLPPKTAQRSGRAMLDAIEDAIQHESDYRPPPMPTEGQKKLLKSMQALVATEAASLGIAAETLASKKDLSAAIIAGDRDGRVFTGWRRELIGDRLLAQL